MALFHVFSEVENRYTGVPMSGVQVVVKFAGSETIAPIYMDQDGTPFTPPNTCVSDADGMYSFYINSGNYDLEFYVGDRLVKEVPNFRPAEVGPTGPANSTYQTTTELENSDILNVSAILAEAGKAGTFTIRNYADFAAEVAADVGKINYIRSVSTPSSVWVRTSILSTGADQTGAASGLTVDAELAAKATLTGVARTATNLGTFTGSTIPDNVAIKSALQAVETAVENTTGNAATKANATAIGVAATDANMGTFTGSTIPDNQTAKQNIQTLETAYESLADPATSANLVRTRSAIPTVAMAAIIPIQNLASRVADIRDWAGYDPTGGNDATATVADMFAQAATAGSKISMPPGITTLTSTVELPALSVIEGASALYKSSTSRRGLTTFNFAHTGKGMTLTGANGGRTLRHISSMRTQPTTTTGWAPTAHDWDFYVDGATDVDFHDIFMLNPTKGIICTNGGGRFSFDKVWGQPLQFGIQVDTSLDVTRFNNIHFWNFWSATQPNAANVEFYMANNATAIYSKRNDNPELSNIFSIFYRYGLRIGNWAGGSAGTTQRLRGVNLGFDACGSGIHVDSDVNGATLQLEGFYAHGHDTVITNGSLIDIAGTNSDVRVYGRTDLSNAHINAARLVGAGSGLTLQDPKVAGYNLANTSNAAFYCDPAAFGMTLRGEVSISGGVGGAPAYAGGGKFFGKLYRSYTPTVSSSTGAITAYSINSAIYNIVDGEVDALVDFTITTNGTGASSILLGLPVNSAAGLFSVGYGDEVALSGKTIRAHIPANSPTCSVLNYDNTYPGGTGARLVVRLRYRI